MKWLKWAAFGAAAWYLYKKFSVPTEPLDRLVEAEDIDAYHADDMQPPFEPETPRDRGERTRG